MGEIKNHDRAAQVIDFSGLRFQNITPTDIDGAMEYRNRAFAFFEMKFEGAPLSQGQTLFLTRLTDAVCKSGKETALFICRHDTRDPKLDVIAEKAWVERIYYRGRWATYPKGLTLGDCIKRWLAFACPEALEEKTWTR